MIILPRSTENNRFSKQQLQLNFQLIKEDYYFWIGLNSLESRDQKWQWESGVSVWFSTHWLISEFGPKKSEKSKFSEEILK